MFVLDAQDRWLTGMTVSFMGCSDDLALIALAAVRRRSSSRASMPIVLRYMSSSGGLGLADRSALASLTRYLAT
jgi:hypothetical protein